MANIAPYWAPPMLALVEPRGTLFLAMKMSLTVMHLTDAGHDSSAPFA